MNRLALHGISLSAGEAASRILKKHPDETLPNISKIMDTEIVSFTAMTLLPMNYFAFNLPYLKTYSASILIAFWVAGR
ncbi:MAG: hypothetical protein ACXWCG_07140 [Flavitalea sp.]